MANEHLFTPFLAAATFDAAQGDPNASLGGFKSSTTIADFEGTITTVNSDREIVDTSLGATDFTGGWVVHLDTNLNEVSEIIDHNTGTDTLTFREELASTPIVTDRYWVFMPNGLFGAFGAVDCRTRDPRHRLTYVYNSTGGQLDDIRCYVQDIQTGPVHCEIAMAVHPFGQNGHYDVIDLSDENDAPVLFSLTDLIWGDPQDFVSRRDFAAAEAGSPFGLGTASAVKSIRDSGTSVNADRPLWVRLRFDPDDPIPLPSTAVFQVFVDSADGVTASSFLVVVDIDGVTEAIAPLIDRRIRIAGGARLSCIVRDSVAPFEPVPGRTISIELISGPGSMNPQSGDIQLATIPASDGVAIRRVYVSPTDVAEIGNTVTFDCEVT